ncbi:MAG: hypothetical protein EHM57_03480 [Actinobacteria bacterium]|nr:MAG: hypothetical protein EHM57_03480 [Actinomycetota bacterium]
MADEEFEHIPWSTLAVREDDRRTRLLYLAAAVAAALVLGIVAARWLAGPRHGADPAAAEEATVTTAAPMDTLPQPVATTTSLLSEADLLAAPPGGGEQMAVMRAEWFITDYFTVDGSPRAVEDLRGAFVDGAVIPALPQEDPASGTTYVEWARAFAVAPFSPGLFTVSVAFRGIYLADGGVFRRGPVRAADVLVAVGDGRSGIAELPSPIPVPPASTLSVAPPPSGEAPPGVAEAALDFAWVFDAEPELISAAGTESEWRVVVGLHDGSGIVFPVAIRSYQP